MSRLAEIMSKMFRISDEFVILALFIAGAGGSKGGVSKKYKWEGN